MDELPILVYQKILSFLGWQERLRCKLVSKRWKISVEMAVPQPLCLYAKEYPCEEWCFSKRSILCEEIVLLRPEKFRDFNSRIEIFANLQKLSFFCINITKFVADLPLLVQLKVLMIKDCYFSSHDPVAFNSSSLEMLSFKFMDVYIFSKFRSIDFNTPNLNSLIFWNDRMSYITRSTAEPFRVNFLSPLNIKHLECIEFDLNFSVLKNLEILVCQKITCPFSLEDFGLLQRLELFPRQEHELDYIKRIMNERSLSRKSLEIFVCGFKGLLIQFKESTNPFRPAGFDNVNFQTSFDLNKRYLGHVAEHPESMCPISWLLNLDIVIFYQIFGGVQIDFLDKLCNVGCIRISDHNRKRKNLFDSSDILKMLVKTWPKEVRIEYSFSKEFYQQLSLIKSIRKLEVRDRFENLDFNQFLKLEHLISLMISTEKLPTDFISKIFGLKFIESFRYLYSNFYLHLSYSRQKYGIYKNVQTKKESKNFQCDLDFDSLEELIEEVNKWKNQNSPYLRGCLI